MSEDMDTTKRQAQAFFQSLAIEIRKPSFGGPQREWTQSLLLRAEEAKLFVPEPP